MSRKSGFTLVEVLIASVILVGVLAAILSVFTQSLKLTQGANNHTMAIEAAQFGLENIRARIDPADETNIISFARLDQWDNQTFQMARLGNNFRVTCYVGRDLDIATAGSQQIDAPLTWRVKVLTCWRESGGRIIGEDQNLNGQLDAGEDQNANGELDSPAQLETVLSTGGP